MSGAEPERGVHFTFIDLRESFMRSALATILVLAAVLLPGSVAAQGGGLASQSFRPYAHVFVAYALAWAVVLGWVISLARRWGRVQDELERDGPT